MKILKFILSSFMTNCYVVFKEDTKEGIIIDPAVEDETIIKQVDKLGIKLKGILLTHGHGDHIAGVNFIKDKYNIDLYASKEEADLLKNPSLNLSSMLGEPVSLEADVELEDGQILDIAGFSFKLIHTPGHTQGSSCYYLEEYDSLFSGDTIFYGSYGRTDFPTGNDAKLMKSIREKILTLPEKTIIYSGHGEETIVGEEKKWY